MESFAAFPNGEWDYSFNRMFSNEELEFTQQFLHQFSFPSQGHDGEGLSFINPSAFCPNPEANFAEINESLLLSSNALDSNFHYNSQGSSPSSNASDSIFASPPIHEAAYYLGDSNIVAATNDIMTMSLDISMDINGGVSDKITGSFSPAFPDIAMEESILNVVEDLSKIDASQPAANVVLAEGMLLKRKVDMLELHAEADKMINGNSSENTKKRSPRVSKEAPNVYKNVQSRKKRKISTSNGNEGEINNIGSDGQSSSTCTSEDDNVSQDNNGDSKASQALNWNGKARASRGSATDPQSLYARKRRERINERLRILQNLVPNGTKVDISTMLEEAVHYVKFLQLQIKVLSSDDLWMYAPIAYNGIDIGLNKKISTLV